MKFRFLSLLTVCGALTAHANDEAVRLIFQKHCSECHDSDPIFDETTNLAELLTKTELVNKIIDFVQRPETDKKKHMPRSSGKPGSEDYRDSLTAEQVATLKAWAQSGGSLAGLTDAEVPVLKSDAPVTKGKQPIVVAISKRPFISMKEEIRSVVDDLHKLDARLMPFTRYLTLTNLYNQRSDTGADLHDDRTMNKFRAGVGKLINSVSLAGRIAVPVAIDTEKTILRIDIRDFKWSADDWETLIAGCYPYALRDVDVAGEREIASSTTSQCGIVRVDWFVFAAAQPPLYHELLKIPNTEQELEQQIGVNSKANLLAGRCVRAGFRNSGVSQGNRLIERHEGTSGMYWKSYDFTPLRRDGQHDLFRSPLGPVGAGLTQNADREFAHDGGEFIFTLPNGLHGYMLATADGKRIDRGPTEIVQDKSREDRVVINGISCMSCHDHGIKDAREKKTGRHQGDLLEDEVGPVALKAGLDRSETQAVQDIYVSANRLQSLLKADEKNYEAALQEAVGGAIPGKDPVEVLCNAFRAQITRETVASEFGEDNSTLVLQMKHSRDLDVSSIAAQFNAGLGFPRASWLDQFHQIATALGFRILAARPLAHAEFNSSASPRAGGNEGRAPVGIGGVLGIATDKARYVKGDLMTVTLRSSQDGFVRLFHQDATGTIKMIFPNAGQPNNFVRANQAVTLPGPGDKFRFRMGAPFGHEFIVAVTSPVQFADADSVKFEGKQLFTDITGARDLHNAIRRGTKGLEVEITDEAKEVIATRPAPITEVRAAYDVSER